MRHVLTMHQGIRMSFPWNVSHHFWGPLPKHAAGDVTIGFCEEASEMLRMCCLWYLNVWFASFKAVHFESFLPLSQMKALLLSLRLFKGKKKPLVKSIRNIVYALIKLLHVRRSANFTTMPQFYLVIRAGPPFPSLPVTSGGLLHTCWVLLHLLLWQRTLRESCVQGRAPPKRTLEIDWSSCTYSI